MCSSKKKYKPHKIAHHIQVLAVNIGNPIGKPQGNKHTCQRQWASWDCKCPLTLLTDLYFCFSVYGWKCWSFDCTIPCATDYLITVAQRQEGKHNTVCTYILILIISCSSKYVLDHYAQASRQEWREAGNWIRRERKKTYQSLLTFCH